jgi:hypothetical protein
MASASCRSSAARLDNCWQICCESTSSDAVNPSAASDDTGSVVTEGYSQLVVDEARGSIRVISLLPTISTFDVSVLATKLVEQAPVDSINLGTEDAVSAR